MRESNFAPLQTVGQHYLTNFFLTFIVLMISVWFSRIQPEVLLLLQGLQYGIVGVSIIFDPRTHLCEDHQV